MYSGIAGLELGVLAAFAEAAIPLQLAWQVEREPFCSRVLAHHFPNVTRYADVESVHHPEHVDVLVGGFACQDVSAAGLGAGLGRETRSGNTWHHFTRIIDETRPHAIVVENVASGAKRWVPRIVSDLRAAGYRPFAVPLGACHVGAPHRRLRVFIVALADGDGDGREGVGGVRVLDGERAARRDDADGRGRPARQVLPNAQQQQQLRDESGRVSGARGASPGVARDDGASVADASVRGCGSRLGDSEHARQPDPPCGGVVGDAAESRRTGPDGAERQGPPPRAERSGDPAACDRGPAESRVGGHADGLPFDVAGHLWPAGRGEDQYAWEPPRAVGREVQVPERPAKLRALGNAVVPQQALVIGRILISLVRVSSAWLQMASASAPP